MKTRLSLGVAVLVGVWAICPAARAEDDEQKISFWMKKKLAYSEAVLEGLTSGDFEQVAKNARSMNALGYFEKWARANTSEYRAQLRIFQNSNEHLIAAADDKNLDGAALAYVQLTLSCVNCHKVVRDNPREGSKRSQ